MVVVLGKGAGGVEVSGVVDGTGGVVLVATLVGGVPGDEAGSCVGGLSVLVELLLDIVKT